MRIRGAIRKPPSNPSRRLYRNVYLVFLDDDGNVLSTHTVQVHRATPAKHAHRAKFEAAIGKPPATAQTLLVSYGRFPKSRVNVQ